VNVGELKEFLEPLDDDLDVELSVHYDKCWHIQKLEKIHVQDNISWITLMGEK